MDSPHGENEVFAEWLKADREHKPALEAELRRLLSRHAYAVCWQQVQERLPDIVNICVFSVMRQAEQGKFREGSKFSTWFEAIVRKRCMSYLKAKITQSQREVSLDAMLESPHGVPEEVAEKSSVKPDEHEGLDARAKVKEILLALQGRDRKLLELKLDGLSDEEIGAQLGVSHLAVRLQWHKIRKRFCAKREGGYHLF